MYAPNVNKLFVFGGDDPDSGTVVNTTRIYDIATDTWTSGAPLPDVRAFMGSGYFNGKIYLVGVIPPVMWTRRLARCGIRP